MTTKPYTPRAGSVPARVLEFLTANPDELLTTGDVAAKFDCGRLSVRSLLSNAVEAGLLTRKEDAEAGEMVYRLGRAPAPAKAAPKPWPAVPQGFSAHRPFGDGRKRRARFVVDDSAITIEKNVPLPPPRARGVRWLKLFARMTVGDSFALPIEAKATVQRAVSQHNKSAGASVQFSVRVTDDGVRVWRVK